MHWTTRLQRPVVFPTFYGEKVAASTPLGNHRKTRRKTSYLQAQWNMIKQILELDLIDDISWWKFDQMKPPIGLMMCTDKATQVIHHDVWFTHLPAQKIIGKPKLRCFSCSFSWNDRMMCAMCGLESTNQRPRMCQGTEQRVIWQWKIQLCEIISYGCPLIVARAGSTILLVIVGNSNYQNWPILNNDWFFATKKPENKHKQCHLPSLPHIHSHLVIIAITIKSTKTLLRVLDPTDLALGATEAIARNQSGFAGAADGFATRVLSVPLMVLLRGETARCCNQKGGRWTGEEGQ